MVVLAWYNNLKCKVYKMILSLSCLVTSYSLSHSIEMQSDPPNHAVHPSSGFTYYEKKTPVSGRYLIKIWGI